VSAYDDDTAKYGHLIEDAPPPPESLKSAAAAQDCGCWARYEGPLVKDFRLSVVHDPPDLHERLAEAERAGYDMAAQRDKAWLARNAAEKARGELAEDLWELRQVLGDKADALADAESRLASLEAENASLRQHPVTALGIEHCGRDCECRDQEDAVVALRALTMKYERSEQEAAALRTRIKEIEGLSSGQADAIMRYLSDRADLKEEAAALRERVAAAERRVKLYRAAIDDHLTRCSLVDAALSRPCAAKKEGE
jgi:uncharacterized protein (UPF0335 family)